MKKQVLIIGTVWPEPKSSAAGARMIQIIETFLKNKYAVTFSTTASKSDYSFDLGSVGVVTQSIKLNDKSFDDFVLELNPSVVLFDRFMIEEQFGWRVSEHCPNSIKILDTEDLHSLRNSRQIALKNNEKFELEMLLENDVAKREIASIYRCDLTLMISKFEMDILENLFNIDSSLFMYLPFMLKAVENQNALPKFKERKHFITIGNFLHPPNWDAVQYLKKEIWPLIRKELPEVQMHVYGAYGAEKVKQLHNEREGFLIKGRADDVNNVMKSAKVCLAPLRFGAGLKGKLTDAMVNGTPNVSSSIAAEGMELESKWGGFVEDEPRFFSERAIELYKNKNQWGYSADMGFELLEQYSEEIHQPNLINRISFLKENLKQHRKNNFMGSLLLHHTMQSTKYLAKWIEAKNS